ncbi:hypothetical protein PM082_020652 [Marasmius tenuissimus]|nr:hypothetical protein PM082_020652 [Marasmius tenuissimus]
MFRPSTSQRCVRSQVAAFRRLYSQQQQQQQRLSEAQPHYSVKRSHSGNLPVYGDIRNAGSRYLLYIRNVTGAEALAKDLSDSLFPRGSPEAQRLKVHTKRSRHVVIQGGQWKNQVVEWLAQKGI